MAVLPAGASANVVELAEPEETDDVEKVMSHGKTTIYRAPR